MFSHPAFVLALEGSDSESEALFAKEYVAAVCGVDGPDCVVFRKVNDVGLCAFIRLHACYS